jgi:AcrR family transcriptional regulator
MSSSSKRRSAILQAATRLFEHYGHGKTTIADVAREARVGVGTVYLEFESKEAIVQALSRSTHIEVLEAMRVASEKSDEDYATRLAAVLRTRTSCFIELRKRGQHACELLHCNAEGVRAAHQSFREQEKSLLAQVVGDGQRAGVFAACDPGSMAALIQRAYASLSPPWIFGSDDDAMRASNDLCQLLLNGLLAAKDPLALAPSSTRQSRSASAPGASRQEQTSSARKPRRGR